MITLLACLSIRADDGFIPPQNDDPPLMSVVALQPTLTIDQGYRVFLIMARDQGNFDADLNVEQMAFDDVHAHLIALCVISPKWNFSPDDCLRRDVVAYMSASYLGVKPGLLTRWFGMTRRYAHREMLFRRIIAPGSPRTVVSGSELLSVMTRISICLDPHQGVNLDADEIH
jgi:hypothetical protein